MHRMSFVAATVVAFSLSVAGWSGLQSAPVAPAAADQSLGMAIMSAVVKSDGSLVRGSGVVSVGHGGLGAYGITFNRSVQNCTFHANTGNTNPGAAATAAVVYTSYTFTSMNMVAVNAMALNGGAYVDANFHLLVFCPQ